MKRAKRFASLLLALMMVFAMMTTAFAAIVNNTSGHTYDAYQIFKGTQSTDSAALGDVTWGSGINSTGFLAALKEDTRFVKEETNIFTACSTAADVAAVLGGYGDKSDVAMAFANVAAQYRTAIKTVIGTEVILEAGYYLLVDTTDVSGGSDARNTALLQVTNKSDITIEKKYDVPTVDKSVTDSDGTKGEAADYTIGSDVPFTLTGTLPTNYADYETYKYVFHDTLSAALKLNGTFDETDATKVLSGVTVKVGDTDITSHFTITYSNNELTVACDNLKAISDLTKDSKIVVEYNAELLATAEIGQPGNSNKVKLEYSNDPNATGNGTTGNTPEDEVLVFTYELDVTKVDGQAIGTKLKDAEFVLMNSDKAKAAKVANGKFVEWVEDSTIAKGTDGTYPEAYTLKSDANGMFALAGLDAGTYYLKETKAPAGYNLLEEEIKIVISATLDKSENNPALTALTISVDDGKPEDGALDTGVVATTVKNNTGATLPETGGMGTTIFYILGGFLAIGAAVLLITKKRMKAER